MYNYPLDYQPSTLTECQLALKHFRQQARDALYMIEKAKDPKYTPLAAEYIPVLESLRQRYIETINRLYEWGIAKERENTCLRNQTSKSQPKS